MVGSAQARMPSQPTYAAATFESALGNGTNGSPFHELPVNATPVQLAALQVADSGTVTDSFTWMLPRGLAPVMPLIEITWPPLPVAGVAVPPADVALPLTVVIDWT